MSREIARGAAWMVLFRLLDRSIGVVSTAILARLLIPADFGLVAMAMSIIAVIELATAFGFEIALIQKRDATREHFDTAWTLNVVIAVLGAAITVAAASPAASFYGDMRLVPVMTAIAVAWMVYGFENIGTVYFRREMNFGAEFRFMAAKRLLAFIVTMTAAWLLQSYWALVIGSMTGRIAGVALSYMMHPYRPRFALTRTRELFSFSGWVLANNIVGVVLSKVPHFFVGRVFGAQAVGTYTVAAEIAQLAQTELIAPINRAMFPGYSRLVAEPQAFRRTCLGATALIMLIVLPVSVGIAVLAGPFIRLLLGAQWGEAVPIIQVLAFAGALQALTSNNVSAYLALGRPHLATATLVARLLVLAVGIAWLYKRFGVLGVAYAELLASMISMAVSLPTMFLTVGLSVHQYLRALWRPLLASAVMGWIVAETTAAPFAELDAARAAWELFGGTLLGITTFPIMLAGLWWAAGKPEAIEIDILRKLLEIWRERRAGQKQPV
ncbi:lipopolysaccharide biosynthesis protein [uncultured Piscinibacter sp.]|uniref:lipopolysaccharide biosynthesis protein n=1 Tax=uncultured Piscinibacter sp. TaxID=1131835 RepID=UPI002606AC8E|nr:lipopolysaccharide biosynthesis protein [uncultured Piscinibacter sp.]